MHIESNKLYTTAEVAVLLRKKPSALASGRCRKDFPLPWVKVGRKVCYKGQDLLEFLEKHRVEVRGEYAQ